MKKEQQIEEMSKYILNACEMGGDIDGECAESVDYRKCEIANKTAESLYNAGYRKTYTSDFASDMQNAFKEGYLKGLETNLESVSESLKNAIDIIVEAVLKNKDLHVT